MLVEVTNSDLAEYFYHFNGYSLGAAQALADYFEGNENLIGDNLELDPVMIESGFKEYTKEEFIERYSNVGIRDVDDDEIFDKVSVNISNYSGVSDFEMKLIRCVCTMHTVIRLDCGNYIVHEFPENAE